MSSALLVAVAAGVASYSVMRRRVLGSLPERTRAILASVTIQPVRVAELQRQWVATGFDPEFLIAPPGPRPCIANEQYYGLNGPDPIEHVLGIVRQQPANRFPALILATELVNTGHYDEAERVTLEALAAGPDVFEKGLPQLQLLTLIYLHHLRGVARLSGTRYEPPWTSLKNAIGGARLLEANGQLGLGRRAVDVFSRAVLIPVPNCKAVRTDALSVEDLYNNVLVAYMHGTYRNPYEREREFAREGVVSALQRLFVGHVRLQRTKLFPNEPELWALSNAEKIVSDGLPSDARLNVNIALVLDWWTSPEHCPASLCNVKLLSELQPLRASLLERAIRMRNVAPQQRAAFARDVTRLLAGAPSDVFVVQSAVTGIRSWLPPREASLLDMLHAASMTRSELPQWIMKERPAPATSYADGLDEAAVYDYITSAIPTVDALPALERRRTIRFLQSLDTGSDVPPDLNRRMREYDWTDRLLIRLTASRWSLAAQSILLAAVLWLAMVCLLVHIWEWRMLRTSLYNVELDYWRMTERE